MYVEAFTNKNRRSREEGYSFGDDLELCYAAWRPDLADTALAEAGERVFEDLNADDGGNIHAFSSLSVGDVISLRTVRGLRGGSFAVKPAGLQAQLYEVWASAAEHNRFREAMGLSPLVRIVVESGVVYLAGKPAGVEVEIADLDDDSQEPVIVKSYPVGAEE